MTAPPRWAPRVDREAYGKFLRERVPRSAHAAWIVGPRDVLARLRASEQGRIDDLVAVRHSRMAENPFGFLRGDAWIMAADLATLPSTGYAVQICGDAHVRNLGAVAASDGTAVFDVNDFDETCRAPWEWEISRLAISLVVAARGVGASDAMARHAAMTLVRSYRETMCALVELPAVALADYYVRRSRNDGEVGRVISRAQRMTHVDFVTKYTATKGHDGRPHLRDIPGKLRPCQGEEAAKVLASLTSYRDSLGPARQQTFDCYLPYDVAFKIAGTGSVGCRNYLVLCAGNGPDDPLLLQVKEALPCAYLAQNLVPRGPLATHEGMRVANGGRRMQTWSDPFLGWTTLEGAPCYVRALADHEASMDPTGLHPRALEEYAEVCGEVFAKAHARTGDPAIIAGYAGTSDKLDRAFAARALAGASQTERDWEILARAIARGEMLAA